MNGLMFEVWFGHYFTFLKINFSLMKNLVLNLQKNLKISNKFEI